ncbi:MAG: hypothetical protein OXG79_09355 [Chloroflexi bacterium]|nr:hypothetical protein [Chloroflexota bacterium]
MKIVCWNMEAKRRSWADLVQMADVDIGLLQEASRVPEDLHQLVDVDHRLWQRRRNAGQGYPSVVARLSDRVGVKFIATGPIGDQFSNDFYTSEWATLGAAIVTPVDGGEPLTVISMAPWSNAFTHESGSPSRREPIGSVHRLISDLARLVGRRSRVIAAGDWVIYPGWSTHPTAIWNKREALHFRTAFDRMQALGFRHVVPEGRRSDRGDVVTFRSISETPAQAWAQADYVFATENIADRVTARALNEPDEWGPSDHCRLVIDLD